MLMKFVFGVLVFIITAIVLIILIVSLLRGLNSTTTPKTVLASSYNLTDSGALEASAKFTVSGPIVADEKHQSVRITIDKSSRKVEILKGYKNIVDKTQTLPNSAEAYGAFLAALKAAQFANYRQNNADIRTSCVTGNRYNFELSAIGTKKVDSWTTSCNGKSGTFAGDASNTAQLFRAQIPNYSDFASGALVN